EYYPASILRINHNPEGKPLKVLTFMQSLPFGNLTNIKGNLTILIDEEKIHEMTKHIELANQSYIYLIAQNQDIISSTADAPPIPITMLDGRNEDAGFFNYTL